ncbi:MAG: hypothetical protein U0452_14410 [Anaerolineae bacterium]
MVAGFNSGVFREIESIWDAHVEALQQFGNIGFLADESGAVLMDCLERLSASCNVSPEHASEQLVDSVERDLSTLDQFLRLTNQDRDAEFGDSELGRLWNKSNSWHRKAQTKRKLTRDDAWDWIEPSIPDTLSEIDLNTFEAKWAAPIPFMDLEILRRTPGVVFCGPPFEPSNLPDGIAVQFTISRSA